MLNACLDICSSSSYSSTVIESLCLCCSRNRWLEFLLYVVDILSVVICLNLLWNLVGGGVIAVEELLLLAHQKVLLIR